jgi:hypothetical protein
MSLLEIIRLCSILLLDAAFFVKKVLIVLLFEKKLCKFANWSGLYGLLQDLE